MPISMTAQTAIADRICGTETRKPSPNCPRTWIETITAARWSRGSRMLGRTTGYVRPKSRADRPVRTGRCPVGSGAIETSVVQRADGLVIGRRDWIRTSSDIVRRESASYAVVMISSSDPWRLDDGHAGLALRREWDDRTPMRAFEGRLDDPQDPHRVARVDGRSPAGTQRLRQQAVELRVRARLHLDGPSPVTDPQLPPMFGLVPPPALVAWQHPAAKRLLLHVESPLLERSVRTQHADPWAADRGHDAHPQVTERPVLVTERDEAVIVHPRTRPAPLDLCVDAGRRPERQHRLIDQMGSEVEQKSAGLLGFGPLPPSRGADRGAPSFEPRLG